MLLRVSVGTRFRTHVAAISDVFKLHNFAFLIKGFSYFVIEFIFYCNFSNKYHDIHLLVFLYDFLTEISHTLENEICVIGGTAAIGDWQGHSCGCKPHLQH